jgi:hypothetical protein
VVGTQHMALECRWLGKVPHVQIGNVDGPERCPEYEIGWGWYPVCGLGMWMTWKATSCTDWDSGWIG